MHEDCPSLQSHPLQQRLRLRWKPRLTASLRRTRTAVSSVCFATAARDCSRTVLADFIRLLLWCGHAFHLQRTTREHFDPNVLESTEVSAVPAEVVDSKTSVEESRAAVQGTAPVAQCKSSSYTFCCDCGVPCYCGQGSTCSGQCEEASCGFCCGVGTPCDCSAPPLNVTV